MIELKDCSKLFGHSIALQSINLKINQSSGLILILGGNGAGKSTLLRVCAGLIVPTSGSVEVSCKISYLSHAPMFYPQLNVKENLNFYSRIQNQTSDNNKLEWLKLEDLTDKIFSELSQGQKARVGLARALNSDSDSALLLDEPCAAFDKYWQECFIDKIKIISKKRLVMIVTHDPEHFISFASRVFILNQGSLLNDFDLREDVSKEQVFKSYAEVLR